MTVEAVTRRAGPFIGDGTGTAFPFEFKIFNTSQLLVQRTLTADDDTSEALKLNTDYTVALNSDQDENPGGTVTLTAPLAKDIRLAIVSAIESTQEVKVTNYDRFLPKTFNEVFDKLTALIQQLEEETSRAIKVGSTDTQTPEELKENLMAAQETAEKYATAAGESAAAAKKSEETTAEYAVAATIIAPLKDQLNTVAGSIESVDTVGTNITSVQTVAGSISNVNTVAGSVEAIGTVVQDLSAVRTVAGIKDAVVTDARIADDIVAVSGIRIAVTTVATNVSSVVNVSAGMPSVKTVATDLKTSQSDPDIDYGSTDDKDYEDTDYGTTDDPLEGDIEISGGNIKIVADAIDAVRTNAANIEVIKGADANAKAAETSKNAAVAAQKNAQAAQKASETARDTAKRWATQTDTPVEDDLYGAKYYAQEAASQATASADSATAAAGSADAAAGSATAAGEAKAGAEAAAGAAAAAKTGAETAAGAAQTSATNAAGSATAAADSAAAAEKSKEEAAKYAESAAKGQVNADWTAETGVAQILNKPKFATVATSGKYGDLSGKPDFDTLILQPDWKQTDPTKKDYIKNKPDLSQVGAQSDWNETDPESVAFIKNKPDLNEIGKQADWNQTDNKQKDFIKNKPTLGGLASKDSVEISDVTGLQEKLDAMGDKDEDYGSTDETAEDEDYGSTDLA